MDNFYGFPKKNGVHFSCDLFHAFPYLFNTDHMSPTYLQSCRRKLVVRVSLLLEKQLLLISRRTKIVKKCPRNKF